MGWTDILAGGAVGAKVRVTEIRLVIALVERIGWAGVYAAVAAGAPGVIDRWEWIHA